MLKNLSLSFWGMFLAVVFVISINNQISAQEKPKNQLWMVHEETAKMDMVSQYEKTSKDWAAMMKDAGLPFNFYAFQRNDLHYYYVTPIFSYASIDSMPMEFQKSIKKLDKDKFSTLMNENNSSIVSTKEFVIEHSAALSYMPKTPRIKLNNAKFVHWTFIKYKLEKRQEVMKVLKDWKSLYDKYNFPDSYDIYLSGIGGDNNEILVFDYAKSASDYYKNDSEKSQEMKNEERKLFGEISQYLIGIEEFSGRPRPDLNYIAN